MRVLVVDDDAAVRSPLGHALSRDGWDVSSASDGAQALQALQALSVVRQDVAILDILIPEPNGLEVCRQIRARATTYPSSC